MLVDELKSRFEELYPPHKCDKCSLEHAVIPTIMVEIKFEDDVAQVPLMPWEIVGIMGGAARPGQNEPNMDTPANIRILFWGPPGTQATAQPRFLYMN